MVNMRSGKYVSGLFTVILFIAFINVSSAQTLAYVGPSSSINNQQNLPSSSTVPSAKPATQTMLDPVFPGGTDSLQRYLFMHINAPDSLYARDISGIIYFSFFVEPDGKVSKVKIEKGVPSPGWDSAAIACIRTMPNWKPGVSNNTPKEMRCFLPVFVPPGHQLFNMPDSVSTK